MGEARLAQLPCCILQVWWLPGDLCLAVPKPLSFHSVCCLWISLRADRVLILELKREETYQ